jgi:hypothetical protein
MEGWRASSGVRFTSLLKGGERGATRLSHRVEEEGEIEDKGVSLDDSVVYGSNKC